ncbi:MAG: phosphotransferase [Rubrivivax sp.]|nr:phosphotransferase [Rubrivivax sp.]
MSRQAWPQDAALPQLATALDAAAMAPVWAGLLPGGQVTLQRCEVDRVKYRPGRNLAVSYRLALQDAQGCFTQRVAARFSSADEAARRHAKALDATLQPTRPGPGHSHVAALGMSAHWWPNDAKLAASVVLADDDALARQWLPPVLQAAGSKAHVHHELTLAQVVPEHRVTARVQIQVRGSTDPVVVYAKADTESRGPVTHAVMQRLWRSPARCAGRLALPQPLLWQPGSGLHWQAGVPGLALQDLLATPAAAAHTGVNAQSGGPTGTRAGMLAFAALPPEMSARVGAQVAALHSCPAPAAPLQTGTMLRQQLALVQTVLCQVRPGLRARVRRLARRLDAGLLDAPTTVGTLHGDLHPRNVLVDESRLTLIDLDSARQGLVVLELGSWLAEGLYRAALHGLDTLATQAAGHAFVQGYVAAGGSRCSTSQLAWATAWQLFCQRVWRCVVNLKPGRYALVEQLLSQCEALLAPATAASSAQAVLA